MYLAGPLKLWPISNIVALYKFQEYRAEGKKIDYTPVPHPYPTGPLDLLNKVLTMIPEVFFVYMMNLIYPLSQ